MLIPICSKCRKTLAYPIKFEGEDMIYQEEYYIDWANNKIFCEKCYKLSLV